MSATSEDSFAILTCADQALGTDHSHTGRMRPAFDYLWITWGCMVSVWRLPEDGHLDAKRVVT